MRYRRREHHEQSSLLECEPMPPPGKGLRRHRRPLIGNVRTHHVRYKTLNEIHSPSTLFWFHVKPAFTRIRYEFPPVYFPPLFVADTLRSAWPCGRAFHQEAAFSCCGSVWPRQGNGDPQSTTPTPRGGEAARPSVSRETAGIPRLPASDGTDVPEQSTTHRFMTTNSALQDPPPPFLRGWRGEL